jgi:anti-anti-sigma regulatory factor
MNDVPDLTEPVVIKLPTQIDIANAGEVGSRLMSGFTWGGVVVADMTATRFCDSLGAKVLLKAHSQASHLDCQLRFALPGGQVLRVLHLLGARANTPINDTGQRTMAAVLADTGRLATLALLGPAAGRPARPPASVPARPNAAQRPTVPDTEERPRHRTDLDLSARHLA